MSAARRSALFLLLAWLMPGGGLGAATLEEGLAAFRNDDYTQAFRLFRELSDQGNARATFYLSLLYARGFGVDPDPGRSLALLRKAAEGGEPMAQYNLGNRYNRKDSPDYDPARAAAWWKKAADQGLALAQHNLGSLYVLGEGVERDLDRARDWYRKAARNGSEKSAAALRDLERIAGQSSPGTPSADGASLVEVDAGWLAAHPGNLFTLQLLSAGSRSEIERLVARHDWKREPLLYRIGGPDGPVWGLGYGVFQGASAARQATGELPKALREGHPWPRALADIRKRLGGAP